MAQRSEQLRAASQKKKSQIEEVQSFGVLTNFEYWPSFEKIKNLKPKNSQRETILKMQQDRIQAEVLKNKKEQEAAILGLQQLKKQQLERKYFLFDMILRSYHFRFGGLNSKLYHFGIIFFSDQIFFIRSCFVDFVFSNRTFE